MDSNELLVGTYNLWEHGVYPDRKGENDRYNSQVKIMRDEFPCHIWLVQEIGSVEAFQRHAERLGMECLATTFDQSPQPVFDPGGCGFGVGVMWNSRAWGGDHSIKPVLGTRRIFTQDVLRSLGLEENFDVVLGDEHVSLGKPHPEIYLAVADQLGVDSGRCIAFEDSPAGVASAKDAGMTVVGILSSHPSESLDKADYLVRDYSQLALM